MAETNSEILIHKFLSGNMTPEEDLLFSEWLAQDPNNLETFNQTQALWDSTGSYQQQFTPGTDGLKSIKQKIKNYESPIPEAIEAPAKTLFYKLALGAAVVVGVGYLVFVSVDDEEPPVELTEQVIEEKMEVVAHEPDAPTPVEEFTYDYKEVEELPEEVNNFYKKEQKKKEEVFLVDSEREIVIKCDEGTILKFEPNSFENEHGDLVAGEVELRVTEYYEYSDMITANLSTTADGELLESGGMIYTEALQNGQKLQLADKKEMEIHFMGWGETDKELYDGEVDDDGNINWILDEDAKHENIEVVLVGGKYAVSERVKMFFKRNYKLSRRDKKALKGVTWTHQISIDEQGEKMGSMNMKSRLKIPENIKSSCDQSFITAMKNFKQEISNARLPMIEEQFGFVALKGNTKYKKSMYDPANVYSASDVKEVTAGYGFTYLTPFSKPKLGWSNLDALFSGKRDIPRTNLAIPLAKGDASEYVLVFGKSKSVLRGQRTKDGYYVFENVPKNEKIAVMAKKEGAFGTQMAYCTTVSNRKFNFKVSEYRPMVKAHVQEMLLELGFAEKNYEMN